MAVARQLIRPMTEEQLREGFLDRGELQTSSAATEDARACALVERGWWVRMQDMTGKLHLDRLDAHRDLSK